MDGLSASDATAAKWRAALVLLFDEIEQHDDMAHNDADEAGDAEDREKPHRHPHDPDAREGADRSEGDGREDNERLDRVLELEDERQIDRDDRGEQDDQRLLLAPQLLLQLPDDFNDPTLQQRVGPCRLVTGAISCSRVS